MLPAKVSRCWIGLSQLRLGIANSKFTNVASTLDGLGGIRFSGRMLKTTRCSNNVCSNSFALKWSPHQRKFAGYGLNFQQMTTGARKCLSPANTQACWRSFKDRGCFTVGDDWNGNFPPATLTLRSASFVKTFRTFLARGIRRNLGRSAAARLDWEKVYTQSSTGLP